MNRRFITNCLEWWVGHPAAFACVVIPLALAVVIATRGCRKLPVKQHGTVTPQEAVRFREQMNSVLDGVHSEEPLRPTDSSKVDRRR